jgi:hypothetical protein
MIEEEIDRFMERLRSTAPEFYVTYCDATYIRLTGIRHREEAVPATAPAMATAK